MTPKEITQGMVDKQFKRLEINLKKAADKSPNKLKTILKKMASEAPEATVSILRKMVIRLIDEVEESKKQIKTTKKHEEKIRKLKEYRMFFLEILVKLQGYKDVKDYQKKNIRIFSKEVRDHLEQNDYEIKIDRSK
ncbi:hypothetical protein COV19_02670 [Candidatus Woesearchaeota archaeon CG10_big_fil_rev_8_21_14_0_10_44_13]|nr:MAG: hypothetical protein COV19_02670 [Candidatus Woesearchaeota archaeon CG10_big_fil_rev_8_21_14_0_10_44_13]